MRRLLPYVVIILLINLCSCWHKKDIDVEKIGYSKEKKDKAEETIKLNRDQIEVNRDVIAKYIERHKWQMEETKTGLYYMIYARTSDIEVQSGCEVEFSFKTSLMNGDILYDSNATGNRKMIIDKNQEEAGLNEGLKLMRKGEKAYFILPPHLAFGVAGDSYKVPPYSILVYEIEIVDIKSGSEKSESDNVVL